MGRVRKSHEVVAEEARAATRLLLKAHEMGPTAADDFCFAMAAAVFLITWASRRSELSAREIAERMAVLFEEQQ